MKKHLEVGNNPLQVISTDLECVVAEVSSIVPGGRQYARLFAAAPEMRSALIFCLDLFDAKGLDILGHAIVKDAVDKAGIDP